MLLSCGVEEPLESPLDCKEIQPVNPKGNQSWIFIGRTYVEAETPILWPPDVKSWLIRKDSDAGKDWRQEEKGMTEEEMIGWHHQLNGHEFEQALGDGEEQESLACCSPGVATTTCSGPQPQGLRLWKGLIWSTLGQQSLLLPEAVGSHSWAVLSRRVRGDFPGGPAVETVLPLQGKQFSSLIRELRSCMLLSVVKK